MPRVISPSMQTHLNSGATTLCWCYKITKANGGVLGFTDHDKTLVFDGVSYEAMSGMTGSELHESLGLSVDNQDIEGVVSSTRITEDDILNGEYDNAQVIMYRVNWENVTDRVTLKIGTIGEVTRSDHYFKAEFRGLSHVLQQEQGRIYQYPCDVALGSPRCGINLASYTYYGSVVSVVDKRVFSCTGGVTALAADFFARGKLTWLSGANLGRSIEIKAHGVSGSITYLEIWQATVVQIANGDTFSISAGCDKQPKTCRDRFANFINFQGFPYMPGQDYVVAYVNKDDSNQDGGSRVNIFG